MSCDDAEEITVHVTAFAAGRVDGQQTIAGLAALLAKRERAAAERAYDDGYNAAATMARCYGHTDYWPEEDEPRNPYRIPPAQRDGEAGR